MKETQKMPLRSEVFSYWKDYIDTQCIDWGEPACWACGDSPWGDVYDIEDCDATMEEIAKNWDKVTRLQRCHIVAKSLGGSNAPENLFLMCVDCHDLAPNTKSKELFLTWAKNQKGRKFMEVKQAIDSFQLTEEEYMKINKVMYDAILNKQFWEWLSMNTSLHRDQKGKGNRLTASTLIAAFIHYCQVTPLE